ncbi:MAG: sensor domain-containing diguanylate cyclase [Candidatus Omnitrophica bacterium]|nr:sensor domain-containing diguanylate cyclase [Candidatus Omnitrophota bacterium]
MYNFFAITFFLLSIIFPLIFFISGKISGYFFYFLIIILFFFFFIFRKILQNINNKFQSNFDKLEETSNLSKKNIKEKEKKLQDLPTVLSKLSSLFEISENLINLTEIDAIYDFIVDAVSKIFLEAENILLFILQSPEKLLLLRSVKRKPLVIKEKEADIIDKWVLKNNYSLLIQDIRQDFRFDFRKIIAYNKRGILSLMVSPISIDKKTIGVLRLESKIANAFMPQDCRLLRSICDLAAIIIERSQLFRQIQELAIKDSLTSLFLRDYFLKRLTEEINRTKISKQSLGVLMLDIDDFKKINDTYGHIVGDIVLKRLAGILTSVIGDAGNLISRFGGEEFIIYLVNYDKERLIKVAEHLRKAIETAIINFRRKTINFTVSIGVAMYPADASSVEDLVVVADKLLYQAKKEGKNKVCFIG